MKKSNCNGNDGHSSSGTRSKSHLSTRITSALLGSALLAGVNAGVVRASDTTSNAITPSDAPPTALPVVVNKQIAAIESNKPKDPAPAVETTDGALDTAAPKLLLKKGQPLIVGSEQEDIQPTDDIELAKEQALHFPDSAEASFVLAVALTRTSRVEEALTEVRRARKLAQAAGGAVYFDKMIKSYEDMLQDTEDPRVRYSLAWAYYMKAYLLAQDSRRAMNNPQAAAAAAAAIAAANAASAQAAGQPASATPTTTTAASTATTTTTTTTATSTTATAAPAAQVTELAPAVTALPLNPNVPTTISAKADKKKVDPAMAMLLLNGLNPGITSKMTPTPNGKMPASQLPMIPTAIQKAAPSAVPQVHEYYAAALKNLDAVLAKKPDDVWALLYRWHLYAEDTGNLGEAMKNWKEAEHRFPSNPGVQLFLAEGYAKEGNLKEAIVHASKAVFLRGTGN